MVAILNGIFFVLALAFLQANLVCSFRQQFMIRRLQSMSKFATLNGVKIESNLKLLSNNIMVKVKESQSMSSGGIYLPDNAVEKPTQGTVVAVGTGKHHHETGVFLATTVKEGESVLYGKYDGVEIDLDGSKHQILKDENVLLTFSGDELTVENAHCASDQVLVKIVKKPDTTASGVVVRAPDAKQASTVGVVMKYGPGARNNQGSPIPMPELAVGDHVKFREFIGHKLKIGGEDFAIVKATDLMAKWKQ